MTLTIQQIQEQAYATACEKGWHDRPLCETYVDGTGENTTVHHDRVLRAHALMHTELTEAADAIDEGHDEMYLGYDGKPEGLPAEIADFIIRVCDVTQALGLTLSVMGGEDWLARTKKMRPAVEIQHGHSHTAARLWIDNVRRFIDYATETARVDNWGRYAEQLSHAVMYAASIVTGFGHDLGAAIEAKMRYNKTRPHRHGGKQA